MNKHRIQSLIAVLMLFGLVTGGLWSASAQGAKPPGATLAQPAAPFKAGTLLVKFEADMSAAMAQDVMAAYGATFERALETPGIQVWRVPEGQELSLAAQLSADPLIAFAEPDYVYSIFVSPHDTTVTPNDTGYSNQWAHPKINSPQAWDITKGSASVTIAIIDTGIDENHGDLSSKIVTGKDYIDGDSNPHDTNGHGTHVAGIAAAITNNNLGVAGMNWNARIMPIRVLGTDGTGLSSDITDGITWAYQNGADVINLSLGGPGYSSAMQSAVTAAHNAGTLVVAAMGNSRTEGNPTNYPAAYNNVMAVAATAPDDTYSYFSQYGSHCDIAAPGGEMGYLHDPDGIYSTMPTYDVYLVTQYGYSKNYDYLHGTSQATPYVAGLAGLIFALDPSATPDEVQQIIQDTAVDLGTAGWDQNYGWGRINAYAAVQAVSPVPAAPTLDPISNGDLNGAYTVSWNAVTDATGYTLQEANNASFAGAANVYNGTGTSHNVTGQSAGVWYYRVKATNANGDSDWSNTESVGVAPAAPTLNAISNATHSDAYTVTWTTSAGATGYTLEEDDNGSFTSPTTRYMGTSTHYAVTGQRDGTWYYRVSAYNAVGDGPWSGDQSTTVDPLPLGAPTLSPINNPDGDGDFTVDWNDVLSATTYVLQESNNPYFDDPTVVYSGAASQAVLTDQPGGTLYFRARAIGATPDVRGPWSDSEAAVVKLYVYLPAVIKNYPASSLGGITNGDFESGADGSWTEYSQNGWDLILNDFSPTTVTAHSGSWAVWLGGDVNEVAYIQQSVTVPSGSSTLSYWHWIASADLCGYDYGYVRVNGTTVQTVDLCSNSNTGGWVQKSVNLSAYAAQTVSLQFRVETNGSFNSNWFIDDVALGSLLLSAEPSAAAEPVDPANAAPRQ